MHFLKSKFFITVRPSQAEGPLIPPIFAKNVTCKQIREGACLATSISSTSTETSRAV